MKRLKSNPGKIAKDHGLPAGAFTKTGLALDGRPVGEQIGILWELFCSSYEWRREEADCLEELQQEVDSLRATIEKLTRNSMVRQILHQMEEQNRTSVFRDDDETDK